jgi:hypothetical protein
MAWAGLSRTRRQLGLRIRSVSRCLCHLFYVSSFSKVSQCSGSVKLNGQRVSGFFVNLEFGRLTLEPALAVSLVAPERRLSFEVVNFSAWLRFYLAVSGCLIFSVS